MATFSLATGETHKNSSGEKVTVTMWHNIVAWSPLAEVAESYIKKGQILYIEGRINYREYTNADGVKKYITEIVAANIQMLGGKKQEEPKADPQPTATPQPQKDPADDLPF